MVQVRDADEEPEEDEDRRKGLFFSKKSTFI